MKRGGAFGIDCVDVNPCGEQVDHFGRFAGLGSG
jgi:hypothetical protein